MSSTQVGPELDPITLEIMWSRLQSAVDEAEAALLRTAFSSVAAESHDFACVLFDAEGQSLAASASGMPGFITTMPRTMRAFLDAYPPESLAEGDVLITNDPWLCAGHLPDFVLATPVFSAGRLVAFAASMAHSTDIGGSLNWLGTREVFEEGLRIPVLKLIERGRRNAAIEQIIRANVRVPGEVAGDLEAQLTANSVMARQVLEFLQEYDLEDVAPLARTIHQRSEMAMREAIDRLPDGVYAHRHLIDGIDGPLEIQVAVRIAHDTISVDYSGTSAQLEQGAINVVYNYTYGATSFFLKAVLLPDLPTAEGFFRPVEVIAPPGSILNATFPAATMSRYNVGAHIEATLACCLAQVLPDRVLAPTGLQFVSKFYGTHDNGDSFGLLSIVGGGMGALSHKDGCHTTMFPSAASNCPVEILESRVPILVREKRLRRDSGGAGRQRGGLGQQVTYAVAADHHRVVMVSFNARMLAHPAPGILGGQPGETLTMELDGRGLHPGDPELQQGLLVLRPGSQLLVATAGGGGVGDPTTRDRRLVQADLADGLVSPAGAARAYGFVPEEPGAH